MNELYRREKAAGGASGLEITESELALINSHTLTPLAAADIFAFKAVACDNEVDRDLEAFSAETLKELAAAFAGRTIISDHGWSAKNQCARVYAAEVVEDANKTTSYGEPYAGLVVRCYMPRTGENREEISLIESGIRKEMSVGCRVKRASCSICGHSYCGGDCPHTVGESYDGTPCFVRLEDADEVYELSFCAVPIQVGAGVCKQKTDGAADGRTELRELTKAVKQLGIELRRQKQEKPESGAAGDIARDPEAVILIESVNSMLKNLKGEM